MHTTIPLAFLFNRNIELSIPSISIPYATRNIAIDFNHS